MQPEPSRCNYQEIFNELLINYQVTFFFLIMPLGTALHLCFEFEQLAAFEMQSDKLQGKAP